MTLPDFFVVGAARSATTSLHYYLQQHPEIVMSATKEPNHFVFDHDDRPARPLIESPSIIAKSVADRAAYEALFAGARPTQRLGEASPLYLYVPEAAANIQAEVPDARIIALLRNPIDRAYSHHMHIHRLPREETVPAFRRACADEIANADDGSRYGVGSHVLRMGRYAEQLERYLDRFGRESVAVLAYESFQREPTNGLARICSLLGVADHTFETDVNYNSAGVTKNAVTAWASGTVRRMQPRIKAILPARAAATVGRIRAKYDRPSAAPPLPDDLRAQLVEWFAPSVEALRALDVVDTSVWSDFD